MNYFRSISVAAILALTPVIGFSNSSEEKTSVKGAELVNDEEFAGSIEYPWDCRNRGIEGYTLVQLRLNEKGEIENYRVLESSNSALTSACLKKIRNLRFNAARNEKGERAPSFYLLRVKFKLNQQPDFFTRN